MALEDRADLKEIQVKAEVKEIATQTLIRHNEITTEEKLTTEKIETPLTADHVRFETEDIGVQATPNTDK